MYIVLENRPDRMGANLTWYIMQFIHAHFLNCFVHCHDLEFEKDRKMPSILIVLDDKDKIIHI